MPSFVKVSPTKHSKEGKEPSSRFVPAAGKQDMYIPEELRREEVGGTLSQKARALGEAGLAIGTGIIGQIGGGLSGLYSLGESLVTGEDDPLENAVESLETVSDALTYDPKTPRGRVLLANLLQSPRGESLQRQARAGGEKTLETTGSPALSTGVQTAIEFLPDVLLGGSRRFHVEPSRKGTEEEPSLAPEREGQTAQVVEEPTEKVRKRDLKVIDRILKREGIDVTNKKTLFKSLQEIGEEIQKPGFASSIRKVRKAVLKKRIAHKKLEGLYWKKAREGGEGFVPRRDLNNFRSFLDESLDGFLFEDMPTASKLRGRLDDILEKTDEDAGIPLSELSRWRKSLNMNMPSDWKSPEASAMRQMKNSLDHFLQTEFATDMISGDPTSLARWRRAINQSHNVKTLFDDDKIIRRFSDAEATPEELRKFIFNASSVGAKDTAVRTVQGLKKILGDDSPHFQALRHESLFNLMEPLVKETPDFKKFGENYERFIKKNPGLVKELFSKKSRDALKALHSASKSASVRQSLKERTMTDLDLGRVGAVALFGHGIAKAQLKVRIARDVFDNMLKAEDTPIKLEIMRDYLGYDPTVSAFRGVGAKTSAVAGVTETADEEREQNKEGN